MASLIPCLLALLFAVNAVYGLQCYNCNSKDSVQCAWGLASFTYNTEQCASVGVLDGLIGAKCYKLTAQNKEGKEYIARGCLPPATIGCSAIAQAVGWVSSHTSNDAESLQNLNCDTCETDKCNSAERMTGVTFAGLILAAIAFLF